jgi:hypothetical protein
VKNEKNDTTIYIWDNMDPIDQDQSFEERKQKQKHMEGSERTDKIDYQIEKRVLKNVKEIS